jgi:hypothetical protein
MAPDRLPLVVHTQYAELLQQLLAAEGRGMVVVRSGSVVTKEIRRRRYVYLQVREASKQRQIYLGPDDERTQAIVARLEQARAEEQPLARERERLVAGLVAAGAHGTSSAETKVIAMLAAAGLFRAGAQIVGTHAFVAYANMLGVRWGGDATRTQDVDVAHDPRLSVAFAEPPEPVNVLAALAAGDTDLRFWPVPQLNPKQPATSFRVAGRSLVVELLTPLRPRGSDKPIELPNLGAAAQPLRYLDYLLEGPERAAVLGADGVLISVPEPARFALHKLLVAAVRPASAAAKARKDVAQASLLLQVLLEDRPASIETAWGELERRGAAWVKKVRGSLERVSPGLRARLAARSVR